VTGLSFIVPERRHAELLLGWRTSERVTRFMFTDITHGPAEQEIWLEAARARPDYRHWLAIERDRPIGLVNLHAIDWPARRAASGFYLGDEQASRLGGFLLPYLYNHAFFDLGFGELTALVMAENTDVLRLHGVHGYRRDGLEPGGVVKQGRRHEVHRLTLSRDSWLDQRTLHRYRAAFPWP